MAKLSPLRIAIPHIFVADLAREMTIPHTLTSLKDQSDAQISDLLCETDVLVHGAFKPSWRDPKRCAVRLIQVVGAGTDGIDFSFVPPGCTVCNVYGHQRGVTEQAFLMMLALHKGLFGLDASLRKGDWSPQRGCLPELGGRNLLILGLGHVGQELVRWGRFMDMKITVLTRSPAKERTGNLDQVVIGGLDAIDAHLPTADFVVVAVPAVAGTIDLIGEKQLRLMKPSAFIINVGRAPVINEEALYQALLKRTIAGAGLDVWYQYPVPGQTRMPSRLPFQELENVIMSPHKPTVETMLYRFKTMAENLRRFAAGEPLLSVVACAT